MSSDTNLEKAICDAIKTCTTNQSMIDITSKHLEELRTQCSSTDKFTQIEIKEAEVGVAVMHVEFSFNFFLVSIKITMGVLYYRGV